MLILMKHIHYLILLLLLSSNISANLKINELMPKNVNYLMDDDYNFSMWVELYNSGSYSINQAAFYFTDDLNFPRKWQPTSHIIEAGKYNILYFEREERYGHANFKLEPDGGVLYLMDAFNQVIDQINYPKQYRNSSYGRINDGSIDFGFFSEPTPGASNNGSIVSTQQCPKPIFSKLGGSYTGSIEFEFVNPSPEDTIYYTFSSDEPTKSNAFKYIPGTKIAVSATRYFRAKTYSHGKIPSEVSTVSYLINQRNFNLPIVSIISPQKYLSDNTIGIYVRGTNGIPGNGTDAPANWNQDWDRPVNFELFDTSKTTKINQEIDIKIAGGWSRTINNQKSLFLSPKKKYGNNKLKYDFFPSQKPGNKYKDVALRNAGNDFSYSMMRDGLLNGIVGSRLNLDYNAYEPAVCFMNGQYYGIQNIRERSGKDFIYSNYGLDENEFQLLDNLDMQNGNSLFTELTNFVKNNDISNSSIYEQIKTKIDVENFIDYHIAEIYTGNYDWPHNNVKIWRSNTDGKWRWIMYDLDFGMSLYDTNLANVNSLQYAMGLTGEPEWATILLRRLLENQEFRNRFIDRYSIHLGSTFKSERVHHFIDSLSSKIGQEIVYHKAKWGSARAFNNDLTIMKSFASTRPSNLYNFIGNQFLSNAVQYKISISSNLPIANYSMNNEPINDNQIEFSSYKNRLLDFKANEVEGYTFKNWEIQSEGSNNLNWISENSNWKYWDQGELDTEDWKFENFIENNWKSGEAQLGYGGKGETTTLEYGGNANNKFISYYFRQNFNLTNKNSKQNFVLTATVDDGAVIYVNGQELGRINMPSGAINFNTLSTTYNNGQTESFIIPDELLREGNNLIATEVHQTSANSSDIIFKLKVDYDSKGNVVTETIENYNFQLNLNGSIQLYAVYEANSTVSTKELTIEDDLKIYPTIAKDMIHIEHAQGKTIYIYDITGKEITKLDAAWMHESIDTQTWPNGIYIIRIAEKNFKIIKQN